MNTPSWTQSSVTFSPAYITSAQTGSCYALDVSGSIYFFNGSSWSPIAPPSGLTDPFIAISGSLDGSLIATSLSSSGYKSSHLFSYGSWSSITTSTSILDISSGDVSNYVYYNNFGQTIKMANGVTSTLSTSGGPSKLTSTLGAGNIWGVDGSGNVYQRYGNSWYSVVGKTLKQIDVSISSSSTLQVCGVDASGNGWMYNNNNGSWVSITKPVFGTKFASLEAGAGKIWATLSNGSLYCGSF